MFPFSRTVCLLVFSALVLSPLAGSAQLKEPGQRGTPTVACPVLFQTLKIRSRRVDFKFFNTSSKTIQGMDFGAAYYDSVQSPRLVHTEGGFRQHIRPEHHQTYSLDISPWQHIGFSGWLVWPTNILYTDGSSWKFDPALPLCRVESWVEKQMKPSVSPALLTVKQTPEWHP